MSNFSMDMTDTKCKCTEYPCPCACHIPDQLVENQYREGELYECSQCGWEENLESRKKSANRDKLVVHHFVYQLLFFIPFL